MKRSHLSVAASNTIEDSRQPRALTRDRTAYFEGEHRFVDVELEDIARHLGREMAWVAAFERYGPAAPAKVNGDFAVAVRDSGGRLFLAVDRFAVRTLCYRAHGAAVQFHSRADILADGTDRWDAQALFNYLYFHVIPSPRTIFEGVSRVAAGHCVVIDRGEVTAEPWWRHAFAENGDRSFPSLRDEFRELLLGATARQAGAHDVGCFLSGGTDSSTVAAMLTEVTGRPARTFSIGFHADGYDEMAYARIAARHFQTEHHEYYVTPDDLVDSIPTVAASFDQPFGNSSVVPTYFCARMARQAGVKRMLGGDGGDELFGGNTRYARQRIFNAYEGLPAAVRSWLVEPLFGSQVMTRTPGLRKIARYVEQARVPMPDRTQMYNLLMGLGLTDVLTPDFLSSIDTSEPITQQRASYDRAADASFVNQMLAFDWRYTLAENDLPKVRGAAALAGVEVGFPLLDDTLVDFSLRLESRMKVKGLKLRWFFKEALRGVLPPATIAKQKHGFGLPFGVWLNSHAGLKSLAVESLRALGRRGIVRQDFIDRLVDRHLAEHAGYYGEMVWILMMLEQWMASASNARTQTSSALDLHQRKAFAQ
jgi:asparagine synthase (glutamine-hydrolysing)